MSRRLLPFVTALVLVAVTMGVLLGATLAETHGAFSYPVDDAYIHLALAKRIAFDGIYGVTREGFSSSSSSILWPWLLAGAMRVVGDHVTLPLGLNLVSAVALLAVIARGLEREAPALDLATQTLVLVVVAAMVPVATLAIVGMEHLLHAALTVAFVLEAARVVSDEDEATAKTWPLVALGGALVATRYEGIAPVAITAALLLVRRRVGLAAVLLAAGALPVVAFGLYSTAHGWLFLPNSVVLKRQHVSVESLRDLAGALGGNILSLIPTRLYLVPLIACPLALFAIEVRRAGLWSKNATRLLLASATTLAHLELASVGWFFRYEAYLVALDVTVVAIALAPRAPFSLLGALRGPRAPLLGAALGAAIATAPLFYRGVLAQVATPTACRNIYEQQVQSARFAAAYFPDDPVALNDIGAVAYFRDAPIVDLMGLADMSVARAKAFDHDRQLSVEELDTLTRRAPVAIVYDDWFPRVPDSWVRVGRLRIARNGVCASDVVSIYATSDRSFPRVLAALRDFAPSLPASVGREGRWTEAALPGDPAAWRAEAGRSPAALRLP